MARFKRGRRSAFNPWSDRVERAPCFRTTDYERLLWREAFEEMHPVHRDTIRAADALIPGFATQFAYEIAHRLFADPVREIPIESREPVTSLRGQLHAQISDPSFASLAASCTMNAHRTRTALASFLHVLADRLQHNQQKAEDAERLIQAAEGVEQALPGSQHAKDAKDRAEQARANQPPINTGGATNHLADHAALQADRIAGDANGSGQGKWMPGSDVDASTMAQAIKGYPEIREMSLLAGRVLPTLTRLADERKTNEAQEKSAIGVGRDVSRLIPRELVDLAGMRGPTLAASAYQRLTDGTALSFGREGRDKLGRGPIVTVIDQSGSMSGSCNTWAKAIMLALAVYARREHRPFAVITYDTCVKSTNAWDRGASMKELLKIAGTFHGGGTNWGKPIDTALALIASKPSYRKADIIHVTDGMPADHGSYESRRARARELKVRMWGVAVGPGALQIAGDANSYLGQWSDAVCAVTNTSEDGSALTLIAKSL